MGPVEFARPVSDDARTKMAYPSFSAPSTPIHPHHLATETIFRGSANIPGWGGARGTECCTDNLVGVGITFCVREVHPKVSIRQIAFT